MREIKFRAWDMIEETMLSWEYFEKNPQEFVNPPKELIRLEYTGLNDKNGKEIYEGDIVKIDGKLYTNHEVRFEEDEGGFCPMLEVFSPTVKWEIVGNIYENPELLK